MTHSSERLEVVSAKISAHDRALVTAVATLAGSSISATVRDLVAYGARERLRELSAAEMTGADSALSGQFAPVSHSL